ncbi:hypothetical protein MVEN_02314400 [Mycena venus]|uniref:Transposase family Tnp2 protein n=1 Tax=Mycena venus TaxID=2733690 RepID=A0A8H6X4N5_9AGAR|nr:hypothetical protein MVEN_02314400 [Mycena venus]
MVYCTCCGKNVSRTTRISHLLGGGSQYVKIRQQSTNLTSRVLDKFVKKKKRKAANTGEASRVTKSARREPSDSNGPADAPPGDEFAPDLCQDADPVPDLAGFDDDLVMIPSTGERVLIDEHLSEQNEDDDGAESEGPTLTFDDQESETELELDPDRLEQASLTAVQILEGEFELEERRRGHKLGPSAMDAIRAHNLKVNIDLGARAYEKTKRAFPQLHDLPSLYELQARIAFLSGIKPVKYHCCKRSCCCFVGLYEALDTCPYCDEPRYDSRRRPRATFDYLPLIPRLKALFADSDMCEELRYRAHYKSGTENISDIFDSLHYRRLRKRNVRANGTVFEHLFFDQDTDIAMGLSADRVCPFKNRKATCWPVIGVLYNLKPELRFLLDHVLCFGVIPGPHEPQDIGSFLIPLCDEFLELARGVRAFDALRERVFTLCAFLIRVFGDMPAMAKLMHMKGPNGIHPCRACKITGIRDMSGGGKTHYVPLHRVDRDDYDPLDLPLRTHDDFINEAIYVSTADSDAEAKRRSRATGINGLPVLANLSSLSFPDSFGHDLMHLIPENVVKNLITLWTDDFKGIEDGNEDYKLQPGAVEAIGAACVAAGDTTPAAFGARVPNIATQLHYFTAESYTLFTTLLGPVVLRNRFLKPKYFMHFLDLVSIFNDCLCISINREYVDTVLRARIAKWVQQYERYYYRYDSARLPICTLTLHALLHIPDDILNAGPMWCYWNYITERFVGFLVRSSKSRKNPYASFARRLCDIAQNNVIKLRYHLHDDLDLSDRREEECQGQAVVGYPGIHVLRPYALGPLTPRVRTAIQNHILRTFDVPDNNTIGIVPEDVSHWGKIRFLGGGDTIRSAEIVQQSECNMTRDATFVKYTHEVDKNRRHRHMPVILERRVAYGQLLRVVEFHANLPTLMECDKHVIQARRLLLAVICPVKIFGHKSVPEIPYYKDGQFHPIEVVDVDDISCLVARVPDHEPGGRSWALCERQDTMGAAEEEET